MLYIGIDLGTSAVKLLLMDGRGEIKNIVSLEYPLEFPPAGLEPAKPRGLEKGRARGHTPAARRL